MTTERAWLDQQLAQATAAAATGERRANRLSWSRLLYAVAAAVVLGIAVPWSWSWLIAAVAPFLLLVHLHRSAESKAGLARGRVAAARAAIARMGRDWENIPPAQPIPLTDIGNRPALRDLDIVGDRSLVRLLDVGLPGVGGVCLLRWLVSDPPPLPVILARQASVAALRARPDLLLENARISRVGSHRRSTTASIGAFREWCEQQGRRLSRTFAWLARLLTALVVGAILIAVFSQDRRLPASAVLTILIPAQLVIAAIARRHLKARLGGAADMFPALTGVTAVMRAVVAERSVDGRFGEIQRLLVDGEAVRVVAGLARLFEWDAVRYSPMLHVALNAAVGFDAHLAVAVDRWHAAHGSTLPRWIDLVGEAQALAALATIGFENPTWTIPAVHDDAEPVVKAEQCGHPLLATDVRVMNPVSLDTTGRVLVVSGSNMSGKTTYLRAVGLNALLAFSGGPVCATGMSIRRCRVRTSVRIEDDLGAGTSLFFAEVSRIREIVEDSVTAGAPPVLFLLDEVLHGTNAADRRLATQLVLRRLITSGSAGIVTTHDPAIAEGFSAVDQRHFTDVVSGEGAELDMKFDYTIRSGPATTTNALRILNRLGLGD